MTFDEEYLKRGLERRARDRNAAFPTAIERMMSTQASRGMLGSGSTLTQMLNIAVNSLNEAVIDASTFVFTVTGEHGPAIAKHLNEFAEGIVVEFSGYLTERIKNTGASGLAVNQQLTRILDTLERRRIEMIDDFEHGIVGSEKMKKGPLVNLVTNQTNSPGAVQQVGLGQFSQSAMVQNYQPLVAAIDELVSSPEAKALPADKKAALTDIADTLKDEAAKPTPNPDKLKRWAQRLLEFATDVGIKVATNSLVQVLTRIFTT